MVTGDMDRTIRFWRDLLGMRLVAGLGSPGYRHYFFQLSDRDLVAFFEWSDIKPMPEKDHGKLDAAGFEVSDVIDHGFIHSIYSFDPNGIPIEFSVNVQGRDIRKNPIVIDRNPSNVTLEGSDPIPGNWPKVNTPTPQSMRRIYPGAGSELFHGMKKKE
jgi:catechol 2,3-dioxygenase-like lactoylglutathione lyase family enzyme